MRFFQWGTFILLCCFYTLCSAQDTVSVFFKLDEAELSQGAIKYLNTTLRHYDLSDVDSVHYIGMADTTGNTKANLKLSEKRARNVARYCKAFFPKNYEYSVMAAGEQKGKNVQRYRRVDIVLYFPPLSIPEDAGNDATISEKGCYYIDYCTLHSCYIGTVRRRGKEFTLLLIEPVDFTNKNNYTGSLSKEGEFKPVKLRWRLRSTGKLWWKRRRYAALIPKESFDRFKIFTIAELPCDSCYAQFTHEMHVTRLMQSYRIDRFLMRNIKVRRPLFVSNRLKARVPREYVHTENKYLSESPGFKWTLPEKGRRKKFAYAKLHTLHSGGVGSGLSYLENIYSRMDSYIPCSGYDSSDECIDNFFIGCSMSQDELILLEEGSFYQHGELIPYAAIALSTSRTRNQFSFLSGINKHSEGMDAGFYAAARYQYSFKPIGFDRLPADSQKHTTPMMARAYAGTELRTYGLSATKRYFEYNVHFGLAVDNTNANGIVQKIFLQCGTGVELLSENKSTTLSLQANSRKGLPFTVQFGIRFNLIEPGPVKTSYAGK